MTRWHAVLDAGTNAVLTIVPSVSGSVFVHQCTLDSIRATSVNIPHYSYSWIRSEPFFLARLNPKEYPGWIWVKKKRQFISNRPDAITSEMIARSLLATAKGAAIIQIFRILNAVRDPVRTGLDFQDRVYLTKERQAILFKESGYDENLVLEVPYVFQYADIARITPKQAANEILFQAKLDSDLLLKTELLRLKYFRALRGASAPAEVSDILWRFNHESTRSSLG